MWVFTDLQGRTWLQDGDSKLIPIDVRPSTMGPVEHKALKIRIRDQRVRSATRKSERPPDG